MDTLEIHLAIYSGNWDDLTSLVEYHWENRDAIGENKLLQIAQLAKGQAPNRAREILEFLTNKYKNNPKILASAYFTATSMGQEDNQNTSDWLNSAVKLSSHDGPLYGVTLEEFLELAASNREQNQMIFDAYEKGTAPIFTIAHVLNRSLSDFYLIQPFENIKNKDIRLKSLIPSHNSARKVHSITEKSILIDPSSILILGYLNLLDSFIDFFDTVYIPHSLLKWLYDEKQKVAFHQPSRIATAIGFERLVNDGFIEVLESRTIENPELAINVGEDLALLLEEAQRGSSIDIQILVACSYPVYKVDSLMELEVDLSTFEKNLVSCNALVHKLKELGAITDVEFEDSIKYINDRT